MLPLFATIAALLAAPVARADDPDAVIVVSASGSGAPRGEIAVAVEVVDEAELERSGAQNVADVLAAQPGVDIQRGLFGSEVRLRGMESDQTLVLIDGVRVLGAKDGVLDLSRIPVDNIERIEIVKGPASAVYGSSALGGVIHIITKEPERDLRGLARVQLGTRESIDATTTLSFGGERWSASLTGGLHGANAWDLDPSDEATNGSGWAQGEAAGRLRYDPSAEVQLTIDASTQLRDLTGVDVGGGGAVLDRTNRIEDHRGGLGATWLVGQTKLSASLRGAVYRDQFLYDQRGSDALDEYEETIESTAATVLRMDHSAGGGHAIAAGLDGEWRELSADRLESGSGTRRRGAVFLQDRWTVPNTALILTPGMRLEADEWFGTALAPKLAARLDPSDRLVLRASVGQGYRAPSLRELLLRFENPGQGYVVDGNPDLQPERSTTADFGTELKVGDAWLSASAFHTEATNLIVVDIPEGAVEQVLGSGETVTFEYTNIGRARLSGVELGVNGRLSEGLTLGASYTGMYTRDLDKKGPLPGRAAHRLSGTVTAGLPEDVVFVFRGSVHSRRPYYPDRIGDELLYGAAVGLLDIRVTGAIGSRLHWFAGLENVFDAGNPLTDPLPPRRFVAGMDVRFGAVPEESR